MHKLKYIIMKVSEGNWIQFGWKCPTDDGDIYFTDDIVTIESLIHIKNQPHNYKPIPLTEDWLLKFGFEKIYFNYGVNLKSLAYRLNNMLIYLKPDFVEIEYCPDWGKFNDRSHILNSKTIGAHPYGIHQLQNLYFALTEKELKLKLK